MLLTFLALLLTGITAGQTDHTGTRLAGIDLGPYAVGFEVQHHARPHAAHQCD